MKFKSTSRDEIAKKILAAQTFGNSAREGNNPPPVKFTLAYDAARIWCEIVLRAEGIIPRSSRGHHEKTISAIVRYLGTEAEPIANQLQQARKTRNDVMYSGELGYVSGSSAENLIETLNKLEKLVLEWLREKHPDLLPMF